MSIKTKQFYCLILPALKWIPHTAFHAGVAFTLTWWNEHMDSFFHGLCNESFHGFHSTLFISWYVGSMHCRTLAAHQLYVMLFYCITEKWMCIWVLYLLCWFTTFMRIFCPCETCTHLCVIHQKFVMFILFVLWWHFKFSFFDAPAEYLMNRPFLLQWRTLNTFFGIHT